MIKTFEQFCAINENNLINNDEQDVKILITKLQPNISKLIKEMKTKMCKYLDDNYQDNIKSYTFEINLNGENYKILTEFKVKMANRKENNKYFYDIIFKLSKFYIYLENNDIKLSNDMLDITEEKYKDLFEPHRINDVDEKVVEKYLYNK